MPAQPNMQQLMKQAQQMQQQLMAAQQELTTIEVEGSAGGGLVRATMTGGGELTALTIDPKAVAPDDVETLQDLVVAAVRDAARAAGDLAQEKMGPLTGGLGGMGLPGFWGCTKARPRTSSPSSGGCPASVRRARNASPSICSPPTLSTYGAWWLPSPR